MWILFSPLLIGAALTIVIIIGIVYWLPRLGSIKVFYLYQITNDVGSMDDDDNGWIHEEGYLSEHKKLLGFLRIICLPIIIPLALLVLIVGGLYMVPILIFNFILNNLIGVDTSAGIQLDLKLEASSTDWTGRVLVIVHRVNKRTTAEVNQLEAKLEDREKAMTAQIRDLKDENDGLKKLLQSNKKETKLLKIILTAQVKKVGAEVEEEDEDTDDDEDKDTNNKVEATQVAQLKEDPDSPPPPPAASSSPPPPRVFDANTVQKPIL